MRGVGALSAALLLLSQLIALSHQRPPSAFAPEALYFKQDASGSATKSKPEGSEEGGLLSSLVGDPVSKLLETGKGTVTKLLSVADTIVFPATVPDATEKPNETEYIFDTRYLVKVPDADCPPNHRDAHGKICRVPE